MAKLRTIDAIRTSVQSIKKYIDSKLPNINIKQDVVKAFDVSNQSEEEWYPEFVTDTLGLIPGVEYKIIVSVDGVPYHGRFTPELADPGFVGVVNFVEDGIENIFFDEVDDANDYFNYNVPRCLGFINLFDKMRFDPNDGEVYDETKAYIHFSVGEYEDGTIEKITGVEIIVPDEQNVLLTGEVIHQELDKKQDKLAYIEEVHQSHHIDINGEPGNVFENEYARITNALNLIPDINYTIKVKYNELIMPSSLNLSDKPNLLLDPAGEATFEWFEDKKYILYNLKAEVVSDESGEDYTILSISYLDGDPLELQLVIYDKTNIDENDAPIYSENTAVIMLYPYFNIEYIEIISSETETIEHKINNDFLKTHRFITEEERSRWNNKQDNVSDAYFIKTLPYISEADDRSLVDDEVDFVRALDDGLYIATQEYLYFSTESNRVDKVDLFHGLDEVYFTIAKHDIIRCVKDSYGETLEYCLVENLNTGVYCMFDVDAGIVALGSINETYLGDVKKIYEYECVEQGVTYTKAEHVTGTMIGGTSYREYQIDEDFVIEKDKKYHVRFVGSNGQVQEFIEEAYYDRELYGNPVYGVYANSIFVHTYKSSDGSNVIKVKVYNSLGIPDMDSITINEIAYLSSEFFDEYRFVTKEEKQEWNEKADKKYVEYIENENNKKQDKIIYKSNETTTISLRNKVPLDGGIFLLDYPLGLVDGEQYSAKIKFAEGIFELEESALFDFLGLERVTDLNYEIKNNYMIFTNKFVAYSENGVMFLQVGNEETSFFMLIDGVGMNLETGDQYLTNDSSALFCLESFVKLIDYVEIIGPRQYEISENFFNTHELVSTFAQDDFDEIVGNIFGDQYKSKAVFTFVDSDAAPKEYKYPYIEEPYYAKELICNIYHDDGTVTTTPFWMMGGEDPGSNYSYVASVSPDNGGVSVMINNVNDKNEWRIVLDYDHSSYFVMPEGISKIEVVVIP